MNTTENENDHSLLASQEPHQREEMDQAEAASAASFTLEPEKGITPDPQEYNKGGAQDNIKQPDEQDHADITMSGGASGFDSVSEVDLDEDETTITSDDLDALDAIDTDQES